MLNDSVNIGKKNKNEIKIFLASSINEFETERNKIGDLVRRMQDDLLEKGIRITLFECEFEDNAMVKGRKQEQYNKKLRESDILILLIGEKAGNFTIEEYKVSKEVKNIKRYIFFKNCNSNDSVDKFRAEIGDDLLHHKLKNKIKDYENEEELYSNVKDIINDCVQCIDKNDLEKEQIKKYNLIFLEGNKDIENDKYAISNFIRNLNDKYKKYHVYFKFITNEDIASLTEQDIKDCSEFYLILGKDIKEEIHKDFDNVYKYFVENSRPNIRLFVRKNIKDRSKNANDFIKYVGDNLQHYYGEYVDIYRIEYEISNKTDDFKISNASIEIIDGSICIDGEEILELDKIAMFNNNEQLIELKEKFEKTEDEYFKLKSSDKTENTKEETKKLEEITEQYYKYKRDIQDLENQIFNFSKKFSKEASKNNLTKKQIAAYKCLERGDLESAKEILNIEDINEDIAHVEEEQESGKKKLLELVQELISRAETYELDINNPNRVNEIYASYEKAINVEEKNNLPRDTFLLFVEFCNKQEDYVKAEELLEKYLKWAEYNNLNVSMDLYIKLSKFYELSGNYEKAKYIIKKLYDRELNNKNNNDLTITKCEIDLAKADIIYSEGEKFWDDNKINEGLKHYSKALQIYTDIVRTLNIDKYNQNDVAVYISIKSAYGIFKYLVVNTVYLFDKRINNYFNFIKSCFDYHKFSTKFDDLNEIKIDTYYKYANYQFDRAEVKEKDYSELVGIYIEIIKYAKKHLYEKTKYYTSIIFDSFNKLEKIYKIYGLYKNLISLYDDEIDVINNKVVILPEGTNATEEIANLTDKKDQAIIDNKETEEKYQEITKNLKNKYYDVAENLLNENNFKKAISVYKDAISYIINNNEIGVNTNNTKSSIRDYFLSEIYSKLAEVEVKNNKPDKAIKNFEECVKIQGVFKRIGYEKYNIGDYELYQYKILQEMIKKNQLEEATEFRTKLLKNIGIEISKNLASNELIEIAKELTDKKISKALNVKEQRINEFVPNRHPRIGIGEIQAEYVDLDGDALVGYPVNLYNDIEELVVDNVTVGSDGKISYYKVPVGMYRMELTGKDDNGRELISKYIYVNGSEKTNIKLVYPRSKDQISFTLVDDDNNPVQGGKIEIYDKEGYCVGDVVTDENGKAYFKSDDDYLSTYYYRLVNIAENYIIDKTLYRVTIDDKNGTPSAFITVELIRGSFVIQVNDKNNEPKEGLKIRILNSDKDEVITITTNKKGLAGVKNLVYGEYYYKFIDRDEMHKFSIKEKDKIVTRKINMQ